MAKRSYTPEESKFLEKLVGENGREDDGWKKTCRAYNEKFKNYPRSLGGLRTEFHRLSRVSGRAKIRSDGAIKRQINFLERLALRMRRMEMNGAELCDLKKENRDLRRELARAQATLRRFGSAWNRAQGAMVLHSKVKH